MENNKTSQKPQDEKVPENFDGVIDEVGFGVWHLQFVIGVCLVVFQAGPVVVGSTFQDAPMAFRCADGISYDGAEGESLAYATPHNETNFDNNCFANSLPIFIEVNDTLHVVSNDHGNEGSNFLPPLKVFEEKQDSEIMEDILCKSFEYDTSLFQSTFMSEYNLVCDKAHLKPLFQMLTTVGYALGNIVGGVLGDRMGRRFTFRFGSVISLVSTFLIVFIHHLPTTLALRFFAGLASMTMFNSIMAAMVENLPTRYRAPAAVVCAGFPYYVAILSLSGIAYFVRNWRYLQYVTCAPAFLYIPLFFLLDESPRWLAMRNRREETAEVLRKAALRNKGKMPSEDALYRTIDNMQESPKKTDPELAGEPAEIAGSAFGCLHPFVGTSWMRKITFLPSIAFFLQCLVYIGVPLNVHNFDGSPFVYVAITAVAQMVAAVVAPIMAGRFSRTKLLAALSVAMGTASLVSLAIPKDQVWAAWLMMSLSMALVASAYMINFTYLPELYPTCIRGKGTAFCTFVGHCSYILAPYITDVLVSFNPIVPNVVFGACGIAAATVYPFLPETSNLPLCETVEQVEKRGKGGSAN
ncbi:organic cation transporter protein-like [Oratosquilla oratoria]|uniref:organic cation transporter protein-like n=1 Tax=Oratosquilla oratoria TaxID=337810 RepID=UPI003F759107